MSWNELQWVVPSHQLQVLAAELFELHTLGVQEDYLPGEEPPPPQPWDDDVQHDEPEFRLLKAWWPEKSDRLESQLTDIKNRLNLSHNPSWSHQQASDWGEDWKVHFKRYRVSEQLIVSPSWEAEVGDLIIDPKSAFGTGEHPTTRACLDAISRWAVSGQICLDVGCGTGILALAAAKLGMNAVGVDIDEESIIEAIENAKINDLVVDFSTVPLQQVTGHYPLVVANLFAEVLAVLAPDIIRLSSHRIALAGILADRVHLVKDAFSSLVLIREQKEGDWIHLWYKSP
ncbi:MAG: 50S ribosomal protein L11 methyltransferase [Myxococcota bacterium]